MNGIERIWLARCGQSHYSSLISFLMSARKTMNGYDNDGKSAFWLSVGVVQNPLGEEKQVKKHRLL